MTTFIDTHIPFDPRHPDAVNPALEYLSWVAWSNPTRDRKNRERFVSAMVSALYKQHGWQVPDSFRRIKRENIGRTARKAIHRIERQRVPAALMTLQRVAQLGKLHAVGLTSEQLERLPDAMAEAAGRLREQYVAPATLQDIGPDAWREARPALAMVLALPISWTRIALKGDNAFAAVAGLCLRGDWVPYAVESARALAFKLEWHLDPPELLVPRRRLVRGIGARLIPKNPTALQGLLNPPPAA